MIQMYKEYKIEKGILEGTGDTLYAVDIKDIRGIDIGGIINGLTSSGYGNDLRFESYPIEDGDSEVLILEIKNDGERYFFKPLISDDYILIMSEDYLYGDNFDSRLGEIKTANNRRIASLKSNDTSMFYGGEYLTPTDEYKDLVSDNPLGVYLTSLVPVSELPNNGFRMIDYNNKYSEDLAHKIGRMKLKAQIQISNSYDKLENYIGKKYSK